VKGKAPDGCFTEIRDPEVGAKGVPNFCTAPVPSLLHGVKISHHFFFFNLFPHDTRMVPPPDTHWVSQGPKQRPLSELHHKAQHSHNTLCKSSSRYTTKIWPGYYALAAIF
jgi:hypothetical protein